MGMPEALSVTSAEFVRRFGRWQDKAATHPLFVTHHGRERLVMLSMDAYRSLTSNGPAAAVSEEEEDRLATVLDRIGQGFMAFNADRRITQINPVASSYMRGSRSGLIGKRLEEAFPGTSNTLLENYLARALRSGETGAFDAPSFAYPGEWLHVQTFPYVDGAAALFRNITDEMASRRLAEATAASETAVRSHGGIGYGWLSPRGTFTRIDGSLATMAGFEVEALAQARMIDILPLNRRVEAGEHLEAVLNGHGPQAFDTALLVNRGGELPIRVALAEMRGDYAADGAVMVVTPR